jgi:outer membrane protein OmpA-like peptidoglycan-associated protein
MAKRAFRLMILGASAAALYVAPLLAQAQEIQGIIVTSENGQITVKTPQGDQALTLSPDARIRSVSGPLGGQKETVPPTALIPGLPVTIEADNSTGQLVATSIEYKAKDYKTAAQIQAGVQQTAQREAELRSAYSKMGSWDIRAEKSVYFKVGSAVLSPEAKQELNSVAQEAKSLNGYVVSVLGYADPTGNAAANERLSNRRAQTVINYLKQSGELMPGRVLSASAMGEMNIPVAEPTSASYENARRVTVRVLTSSAHLAK